MLKFSEYRQLDALAAAEGISNGDFTSAELTACAIARATEINPEINAIVHESFEFALDEARRIDGETAPRARSRVEGVPFLIKDLAEVEGVAASFGSALFEGHVSSKSSPIVSRYQQAGLPLLGKTNTPEFGLTITTEAKASGPCRNPWNLDYSTGGSSGGAAAAVAAGIVPVAHASDGGGSIRIPASCCGLFGLKPSRGLTEVGASLSESWGGMSVGHVISRSVRDSAAFLDLIRLQRSKLYPRPAGPDSFLDALTDSPENETRLRIGVQYTHPAGETLDTECVNAVKTAAALCESLGHRVEELVHPVDHVLANKAMSRLINVYSYQAVSRRAAVLQLALEDCPVESSTLAMAQRGAGVSASEFLAACESLMTAEGQLRAFYRDYDVILQPVLSLPPARLGWLDMNSDDLRDYGARFKAYSGLTALANGTGLPSMSVPITHSAAGLPIGAMFTAAWGADSTLLRLAAQIESAAPWPGQAKND